LPHESRNLREVALFPQRFIWIHDGGLYSPHETATKETKITGEKDRIGL
jgi:hypothetical protein